MGRLIVFEGPDKSGKSTQAKQVVEKLSSGYKVATFHFPNYDSPTGSKIKSILMDKDHDYRNELSSVMKFAVLQIEDKMVCRDILKKMLEENDFVILDRFIPVSAVFDEVTLKRLLTLPNAPNPDEINEAIVDLKCGYSMVTEGFDAEYVYFKRSDFIARICKSNNREQDVLDSDDSFQKTVDGIYCREFSNPGRYNVLMTIDTDILACSYTYRTETELRDLITDLIVSKIILSQPSV